MKKKVKCINLNNDDDLSSRFPDDQCEEICCFQDDTTNSADVSILYILVVHQDDVIVLPSV